MLQSKYYTEEDLKEFGFKSIGKNVRISSDARIYGQENICIGNHVRIDDFAILSASKGYIFIEDYVSISRNCHISGTIGVRLKSFSVLSANVLIYSASHDYSGNFLTGHVVNQDLIKQNGGEVIVGEHVFVGCGSVITGPAIINKGSIIGSMSFVKKDLEAWGMYAGIPVKRIKDRAKNLLDLEHQNKKSHKWEW